MLIAQLEHASGMGRDTIRYYERLGLITPPVRTDNSYRHYDAHTLVELQFIAKAQEVGFTLQQIKPAIAKLHAPPEQCQELIGTLLAKGEEIAQRIAQEQIRLSRLQKMVARLQNRS